MFFSCHAWWVAKWMGMIGALVRWDIALLARMMLRLEVTTGSDMGERRGEDMGIAGKKYRPPPP